MPVRAGTRPEERRPGALDCDRTRARAVEFVARINSRGTPTLGPRVVPRVPFADTSELNQTATRLTAAARSTRGPRSESERAGGYAWRRSRYRRDSARP